MRGGAQSRPRRDSGPISCYPWHMTRIVRSIGFAPAAAMLAAAMLAGCASWGETPDPTRDWSAQRLYDAAKDRLESGDYEKAIEYYEKLEVRYPFGPLAMQAQLDIVYAYYKSTEPASALAAADRFIKLHPLHPNVDYAYYLKGLVTFGEDRSVLDRLFPKDRSEHDPDAALRSFRVFEELVQRFPGSRYSEDSRQRMLYLKNVLAAHEVRVARYYMKRGAWLAAANRARYVVENYQGTPAVSDSLAIMATAYRRLGLDDLSADVVRVLELNAPERAGPGEP